MVDWSNQLIGSFQEFCDGIGGEDDITLDEIDEIWVEKVWDTLSFPTTFGIWNMTRKQFSESNMKLYREAPLLDCQGISIS